MDSIKEIISGLQNSIKNHQDITLINVYKGVPVSFPARVLSVSTDTALVNVNKYSAICITQSHHTFVRCPALAQAVRADVSSLDLDRNLAVLNNMKYAGTSIGGRNQVRVEPEEEIRVTIYNGIYAEADMLNLSLHGIAIRLDTPSFAPRAFGVGQKIRLHFRLPGFENTPLTITGNVKSVQISDSPTGFRLGIRTAPDAQSELTLSRYIAGRQAAILREIKTQQPYAP